MIAHRLRRPTTRLGPLPPIVALAALLAACGNTTADPAAEATTSASSPSTSSTSTATSSSASSTSSAADGIPDGPAEGTGTGCAANAATVPEGAGSAESGDVDLDGQPDTVWLADTPERTLGVTTASGATFSTTFTSAAPEAATALAQRLQPAGPAVVLLNTGRSVALYAVVDCELVPTQDAQGEPYTFDLGFTGGGTGVGCVAGGDEEDLSLAGLNAEDTGGGTFRVTQTVVELSDGGLRASNGATTVVAEGVGADDPYVANARTVGCGNQTQVATEPR